MRWLDPQLGHASEEGGAVAGTAPEAGDAIVFELERGREATEGREEGAMFLYAPVPETSIYTFIRGGVSLVITHATPYRGLDRLWNEMAWSG
jgi:hypothetical protein